MSLELRYRSARWPFRHAIADNAHPEAEALARAAEAFTAGERDRFYCYDNPLERKLAFDLIDQLPGPLAEVLQEMNGPAFLEFLEGVLEIDGLIPDPYLRGGGLHAIPPGGHLDVHVDFNVHPKLGLHRRANALLYLNRGWQPGPGGALELWTAGPDGRPQSLARRISPLLGRLVIFETSERSLHGHPIPAPAWRYALSAYYYTAAAPADAVPAHSTRFYALPGEAPDPERDALRAARDRGRLSSNVEGRS